MNAVVYRLFTLGRSTTRIRPAIGTPVACACERLDGVERRNFLCRVQMRHFMIAGDCSTMGTPAICTPTCIEGASWFGVDQAQILRTGQKAPFEQYWQEPEFEDYDPGRDAERLDRALSQESHGGGRGDDNLVPLLIDVAPKPHQAVVLEALESERLRGYHRNLVVAATGTGKTWIAAFDYKRLRSEGSGDSLLFIAHRDEILRQSQQVFQLVLREPGFGERLVAGVRPRSGRFVFASVMSLANRIDELDPDAYDVVIVDGS